MIEYIIIDGNSSDSTLKVIKEYEDQIDYWLSESDRGIYSAMNKRLKLTDGEIIGILNSYDFYFKISIQEVVKSFHKKNIGIYYGRQMNYIEYSDFFHFSYMIPNLHRLFDHPSVYHPSCFVHKSVYQTIGTFTEDFMIISDDDFLLRARENNIDFFFIDKILTGFRSGGRSSNYLAWKEAFKLKNAPIFKLE